MRIVFMGTPDFAVPTLGAVLDAGHEIAAVYTQPPRPAGRGMDLRKSPVQRFAEERSLEVRTPERLKSEEEQTRFAALGADAGVVVAYGLILPKPVLQAPHHGCLNLHASMLPRWRGAAPIQRAIMAGDTESGICVMRMEEGLDTGPVCLAETVPIGPDTTAGELHDALAERGADLMARALDALSRGRLDCTPQSEEGLAYAHKIEAVEARIDWSLPSQQVHNHIRGLSPFPGAWFEAELGGKRAGIKVLRSTLAKGEGAPGTVLDDALTIACGEGAVCLLEVQRAGKKPMQAGEFLRGAKLTAGSVLT